MAGYLKMLFTYFPSNSVMNLNVSRSTDLQQLMQVLSGLSDRKCVLASDEMKPFPSVLCNLTPIDGLQFPQIRLHGVTPTIPRATNRSSNCVLPQIDSLYISIFCHPFQITLSAKSVRFGLTGQIIFYLSVYADSSDTILSLDWLQHFPEEKFSTTVIINYYLNDNKAQSSSAKSRFDSKAF